jgi:pyruvate dehydrogenase E2 component (dihydrolipoyllysine-residue acetyltransferase)
MAVEVTMPRFGLTMSEGTVQRFFMALGEAVRAGEPLYEVETEKVLYQVEAPVSGTLAVRFCEDRATIECGRPVAVIAEPGDDLEVVAARYRGAPGPAKKPSPAKAAAPGPSGGSADAGGERRAVSPVARKLAAQLNVDLAKVTGSGPGGRITREDIERAAQGAKAEASAAAAGERPAEGATIIPFRGMRKTIATRMHQSLRDAAQLTITTEADVTAATELRARLSREFDFTYTDLMIHALARALVRHPRMNARATDDSIALMPEQNIGMAVALDEGLIVPVIREAGKKTLREIAALTRELGEKARSGALALEDVSGGTFTVTNLGTYGVDAFTPIINLGEAGILGMGRIIEKPVIYRGEVARRSMATLSLTFDHRLIDGAPAAKFLQTVIEVFNYGER